MHTQIHKVRWSAAQYLGIAGALLSLAGWTQASIIVRETFDYPSGNLVGNNGGISLGAGNQWTGPWTNNPGTAASAFQVTGSAVNTPGNITASQFYVRPFTESLGLTTYYFGFDLRIPVGSGAADDDMFAGMELSPTTNAASGQSDGFIYSYKFSGQTGTNHNLYANFGGASAPVNASTRISEGPNHRVIGRITYGAGATDQLSVWLDPVNELSTPLYTLSGDDVGSTLGPEYMVLYRDRVNASLVSIGDARVATTFTEAIPELTTTSLMGLASGLWLMHRRRK